jgi:hypothetical protein
MARHFENTAAYVSVRVPAALPLVSALLLSACGGGGTSSLGGAANLNGTSPGVAAIAITPARSSAAASASTTPGPNWTLHAFQGGGTAAPMAYSGSRFVLPAEPMTSTDGSTWHPLENVNNSQTCWGVGPGGGPIVWTGSQFVVVAINGAFSATSPDGLNWVCYKHSPALGAGSEVIGLASSGAQLVATGPGGFLTSSDGVTWTQRASVKNDNMGPIVWTGSKFYALGAQSVQTSVDGATWTALPTTGPGLANALVWSGTRFVAVGQILAMRGSIQTSTDGITWTVVSHSPWNAYTFSSVVWSGSKFVAVGFQACCGYAGSPGGAIATSPDGLTWTVQNQSPPGEYLHTVLWSGSRFVVAGEFGIQTSPDAVTWTYVAPYLGQSGSLNGVVWSGSKFVAVGPHGLIFDSPDGSKWTSRTSDVTNSLTCIAWNGSRYAVGMDNGDILTSTDGISWIVRPTGTTSKVDAITWTGSQFIAVGANSLILTSPDGVSWTARVSGINTGELRSIAFLQGHYVAANGGALITSNDGVTWKLLNNGLGAVAASATEFVAYGGLGTSVFTSSDGAVWTPHSTAFSQAQLTSSGSAVWASGITSSAGWHLFASTDGVTWSDFGDLGDPNSVSVTSVATNGSTTVAVRGGGGTNLLSLP